MLLRARPAGDTTPNARVYNSIVSAILFVTVLFANFAESVAEARKAQAASLKKTKKDTQARLLDADGGERMVPSSELKKGDGDGGCGRVILGDGEVIEGIAWWMNPPSPANPRRWCARQAAISAL